MVRDFLKDRDRWVAQHLLPVAAVVERSPMRLSMTAAGGDQAPGCAQRPR